MKFSQAQKEKIPINTYLLPGTHKQKVLPRKYKVELFIKQNKKEFNNKNWIKIKEYVYNCYRNQ